MFGHKRARELAARVRILDQEVDSLQRLLTEQERGAAAPLVDREAVMVSSMYEAAMRQIAANEKYLAWAPEAAEMNAIREDAMLAELKSMRSVIGALGGTMGTVETLMQQLTQMIRDWRTESQGQ
jgi:prefoldin subunit 5